jgi:hypothetical protein
MRRVGFFVALVIVIATFFWARRYLVPPDEPKHNPKDIARVEPSPVCPWRNPEGDLSVLFPAATNYELEPRTVSGLTVPIQKRLGRLMHPDENPLRIHRVRHQGQVIGSVLVTRVKGEHGGIEIVIGVETNGSIRGVLVQSLREPSDVAGAIAGEWLQNFRGKNADAPLRLGTDLPQVRESARASAQAIATGVRDQLVVLSFAELSQETREHRQRLRQ